MSLVPATTRRDGSCSADGEKAGAALPIRQERLFPLSYGLPADYRINAAPAYFAAPPDELGNQFAVYEVARSIFEQETFEVVVDVGCGAGEKLIHFWPDTPTIGIEYGSNLDRCRQTFPQRDWREANLERAGLEQMLPDWNDHLVICADVIEHLIQPEHLLALCRHVTQHGGRCVISTPERDLCRGRHDRGPPQNRCHVREWNLGEFFMLVSAYCPIRHVQLVPWRPVAERAETIVVEV